MVEFDVCILESKDQVQQMPSPVFERKNVLLAISLSLAVSSCLWQCAQVFKPVGAQGLSTIPPKLNEQEQQFSLQFSETAGVRVNLFPYNQSVPGVPFLLKVNGRSVKGLTERQILKLIGGGTAAIEVLTADGRVWHTKASPQAAVPLGNDSKNFSTVVCSLYIYDGSNTIAGTRMGLQMLGDDEYSNVVQLLLADSRCIAERADDEPETSGPSKASVAAACAAAELSVGLLPQAKANLRKLIANLQVPADYPPIFDRRIRQAFDAAVLFNLKDEARLIGENVSRSLLAGRYYQGDKRFGDDEENLFVQSYAKMLAKSSPAEALQFMKDYLAISKLPKGRFGPATPAWFAEFYAACGDYAQAAQAYEKSLQEFARYRGSEGKFKYEQIGLAQSHCYALLRLSEFASAVGDWDKAIAYLSQARLIYAENFSADTMKQMENLSQFCPSPALLEFSLAEAQLHKGDVSSTAEAMNSLERGLRSGALRSGAAARDALLAELKTGAWRKRFYWPEDKFEPVTHTVGPVPNIDQISFAASLRELHALLECKEKLSTVDLDKRIEALFLTWKERPSRLQGPRPSINMYCCLVALARRLAEQGYVKEADGLFSRLLNSNAPENEAVLPRFLLELELAALSGNFNNVDKSVGDRPGLSAGQIFRGLADLYLDMGSYKESELFLQKAESAALQCEADASDGVPAERRLQSQLLKPLISLDRARLASGRGDCALLKSFFDASMSQIRDLPIKSASRDLDSFNRRYLFGVLALARHEHLSDRSKNAIDILGRVIAQCNEKSSWLGVFDYADSRNSVDHSLAYLKGYLGRLLFESGNLKEARKYLDLSTAELKDGTPRFVLYALAKCSYAQGDYLAASGAYSRLVSGYFGFDGEGLSMALMPDLKVIYARTALTAALQAKTASSSEPAKTAASTAQAETTASTGLTKTISSTELAKRYDELAELLNRPQERAEKLQLYTKALEQAKDDAAAYQRLAMKIANLSSESGDVNLRLKMVELASKKARLSGNAQATLLQLACEEQRAGHYDAAVQHFKEAIAAAVRKPDNSFSYCDTFFASYDWELYELKKAGRKKDAGALYLALLDKAKALYGEKSAEYMSVLKYLCSFSAEQGNISEASRYLDLYLAIDPRKLELGKSTQFTVVPDMASTLASLALKPASADFGKRGLERLLQRERALYGPNHMKVANVLLAQSKVECESRRFDTAETLAREALRIQEMNYSGNSIMGMGNQSARAFLFEIFSKSKDKAKYEKLEAYFKSRQTDNAGPRPLPSNAGARERQEFIKYWQEREPYGFRTLEATMDALAAARKKENWQEVKVLAPRCIELLAHNSPFLSGGCMPQPSPATRKYSCYKTLIEALLKTGDRASASKWLNRAISEKCYNSSPEELLFLGEIECLLGEKEKALAYCKEALQSKRGRSDFRLYEHELVELLKRVAPRQELEKAQADQNVARLKELIEQYRKNAEERQRMAQRMSEANAKEAPVKSAPTFGKITPTAHVIFRQPVSEIADGFSFHYAILADSLTFEKGAFLKRSYDGPALNPYSFAGAFSKLKAEQPVHRAGNFTFLFDGEGLKPPPELPALPQGASGVTGGPVGIVMPIGGGVGGAVGGAGGPAAFPFSGAGGSTGTLDGFVLPPGAIGGGGFLVMAGLFGPPPVMARPFRTAPMPPTNVKKIDSKESDLVLEKGDYVADRLQLASLLLPKMQKVRIFLSPGSGPAESAITTNFAASINGEPSWTRSELAGQLEIWYGGSGTINLGDYTCFCGILYAPNASVRIGKGCQFVGAMVAKDVVVGEDSLVLYSPPLAHWRPAP